MSRADFVWAPEVRVGDRGGLTTHDEARPRRRDRVSHLSGPGPWVSPWGRSAGSAHDDLAAQHAHAARERERPRLLRREFDHRLPAGGQRLPYAERRDQELLAAA